MDLVAGQDVMEFPAGNLISKTISIPPEISPLIHSEVTKFLQSGFPKQGVPHDLRDSVVRVNFESKRPEILRPHSIRNRYASNVIEMYKASTVGFRLTKVYCNL